MRDLRRVVPRAGEGLRTVRCGQTRTARRHRESRHRGTQEADGRSGVGAEGRSGAHDVPVEIQPLHANVYRLCTKKRCGHLHNELGRSDRQHWYVRPLARRHFVLHAVSNQGVARVVQWRRCDAVAACWVGVNRIESAADDAYHIGCLGLGRNEALHGERHRGPVAAIWLRRAHGDGAAEIERKIAVARCRRV